MEGSERWPAADRAHSANRRRHVRLHRASREHYFSVGHGHWAYGASDVVIDGDTVEGDRRRAAGFHGNAAMRIDPHLKDTCLADLTGGSAGLL